jgi:mono/diheme cytochrome c family protein
LSVKYLAVVLVIGCASSKPAPAVAPAPESSVAAPVASEVPLVAPNTDRDALALQIEQGKQLYVDKCARCHGDAGQGTKDAPPVVGKDAFPLEPRKTQKKRTTKFRTAADVFAFASKTMPGDAPGSLTTEQYLAIFAFDLTANGVKLERPLDGAAAQAIVLHP